MCSARKPREVKRQAGGAETSWHQRAALVLIDLQGCVCANLPFNNCQDILPVAGGEILFGTDVGFITDYDPTDEYQLMGQAGMSFRQILASLTAAPAERFDVSSRTGRIGLGMDADMVVLKGDPAVDINAFSNVRYTLRRGRIIFSQHP